MTQTPLWYIGTIQAVVLALLPTFASAQLNAFATTHEEQLVQSAALVLSETMNRPGNRIPESMLADASGVAIVPNVVKGSFIIGARHGRGLLFVRQADGVWHAPVFITLTGGNFGWQIGVQSSDVVLVFKTPRSIQGLLSSKLTIGGDVAAAAGPVGRQAAIATDKNLQAEIYTYSRSRGLFAGVSIDGSIVQVDSLATAAYYQSPAPGQPAVVPVSALNLTSAIAAYAGSGAAESAVPLDHSQPAALYPRELAGQTTASEAELIRTQIVQLSPQFYRQLDDSWKNYLALPAAILPAANMPAANIMEPQHPDPQEIQSVIKRFDRVAEDPAYRALLLIPEFQSLAGLLKHYHQALMARQNAAPESEIQLPPPPM